MPTIITRGAGSAQGLGYAASSAEATFIEDIFSTYLYTGNGSTQTITNGIDLAGKGGLTWIKSRTTAQNHRLVDTIRGATKSIRSSSNQAQFTEVTGLTSFSSTGFSLGADVAYNDIDILYASWTFREQPKFFDVVTYTGTGANRTVAHALGSVPGCIMVKRTDTSADWQVYHRSLANTEYMVLNDTAAVATGATRWNSTTPTSTVFSLGTDATVNASGGTYVAYLSAHNAGGFGLTGTDNVISCGSYVGSSGPSFPVINLGYEPQWVLVKNTSAETANDWMLFDNMRGFGFDSVHGYNLKPNLSNAEQNLYTITPNATGFSPTTNGGQTNGAGQTYIYIAIRRGPMKVPTSGTQIYNAILRTGTGGVTNITGVGFPPDFVHSQSTNSYGANGIFDRLRGPPGQLRPASTVAEQTTTDITAYLMDGVTTGNSVAYINDSGIPYINHFFRRAPGFFDVVCYTGNDTARALTHNLAAVPEMMIVKARSSTSNWSVYTAATAATNVMYLNTTNASFSASGYWSNTAPTASVFTIGNTGDVNNTGTTFVAYLFATVAGVSKVGTYTGTGTTQIINCGFTSGARFVLIKRTDSTGDWYVWDSARGIVAGNDPYLWLNSTAAEVTNTDFVDTAASGFEISSTAPAAINANGGSFIFLAIA